MLPATPFRRRIVCLLCKGLDQCPHLAMPAALKLTGAGMLLTVVLAALLIALPLGALLGWF